MDDRGVYFKRVILGIDFERTDLSSEVSGKVPLPLLHATAHKKCVKNNDLLWHLALIIYIHHSFLAVK